MPIPLAAAIIGSTILAEGSRHIGNAIARKNEKKQLKKNKSEQKSANEKNAKRSAKETKRETKAALLEEEMNRSLKREKENLMSKDRFNKRKTQASQNTADLVREALNI